jgi:malic enzyme
VKPLPPPYDTIAAGLPTELDMTGHRLLSSRMLTKDLAFTDAERDGFGLRGLVPDHVMTIEEQVQLEMNHFHSRTDPLDQYIGLMALQDRNATLYYRVLAENLEELLPIVYTPTVGLACQKFSHVLRRTRGLWITPKDRDRIPDLLRSTPYADVRLIVITDNERILGLGDQGAGGMGIPLGKLALYTAACGIHPAVTLPVSLDVGTDNQDLLADPFYIGYRAPRLRGPEYDALVDAFVTAVSEVWPGCLIQWEDFKQHNALGILDRYRGDVFSFNDDIQGTAATVLAGLLAALRQRGSALRDQRAVLVGAGAAGIGIARLLRAAMIEDGATQAEAAARVVLVDSRGLVLAGRAGLEATKRELALPAEAATAYGFGGDEPADLLEVVGRVRPAILIGTTGVRDTFSEPVIRTLAQGTSQPIVMPLSNPTSSAEATPSDILRWTGGTAQVATGSPFEAVVLDGVRHEIGQANNVFIFPGLGLGAIVAEARQVTKEMVIVAARTLSEATSSARIAAGALYPPVTDLRIVSRAVALAVAAEAVRSGVADLRADANLEAEVDAAMWWPAYTPYLPVNS